MIIFINKSDMKFVRYFYLMYRHSVSACAGMTNVIQSVEFTRFVIRIASE